MPRGPAMGPGSGRLRAWMAVAAVVAAVLVPHSGCGSGGSSALLEVSAERGSRLDLGTSGRAHQLAFPRGLVFLGRLEGCTEGQQHGRCDFRGADTPGEPFGPPIPLLDPRAPLCLVARSSAQPTGAFYREKGCGTFELPLRWEAFVKPVQEDFPCPVCVGGPRPADHAREGTCSGGDNAGQPCDAAVAPWVSGRTSLDCPPASGRLVSFWESTLVLTTESLEALAADVCRTDEVSSAGDCLCDPSQFPPNCSSDDLVYRCSKEPLQECAPASGSAQCEFLHPGYGTCEAHPLSCFARPSFTLAGTCHPSAPTMVGFLCIPASSSAALYPLIGLPSPGLMKLKAKVTAR